MVETAQLPAVGSRLILQAPVKLGVCLHHGTSWLSSLIKWQTRGRYSHASLLLPDGAHVEAREGRGVVRHRGFTAPQGETADVFELLITAEQAEAIEAFILGELGAKYDWRAVFSFVSRSTPKGASADKWFCSEFVVSALEAAGIELFRATTPWEVSPALLGRALRLGAHPTRTICPA